MVHGGFEETALRMYVRLVRHVDRKKTGARGVDKISALYLVGDDLG
jgi:hypothetical protein